MSWLDTCAAFVAHWEGCRLHAYPDPASGGEPWTIGYGATGPAIGPDTIWTQAQADADLQMRLIALNTQITRAIRVRITDNQRAALVSLSYNIGIGNFLRSTLLRRLNAGDYDAAASQFAVWSRAGGQVMPGLLARREAEAELFRSES